MNFGFWHTAPYSVRRFGFCLNFNSGQREVTMKQKYPSRVQS
jgi:hypothetical protein